MAVLTGSQLTKLRQDCEARDDFVSVPALIKALLDAMHQAFEDKYEADKLEWSAAADAATTAITPGFTFTAAQKKLAFAFWCRQRFERDS